MASLPWGFESPLSHHLPAGAGSPFSILNSLFELRTFRWAGWKPADRPPGMGDHDAAAITILSRTNALLFSSNWKGAKTDEQTIGGGNIQVH